MAVIDHLILNVNEVSSSVDFYINVLGFELEGEEGPFTVIRVNEDFTLQLAPWGTGGNEHLAFALSREAFDNAFARVKEKGRHRIAWVIWGMLSQPISLFTTFRSCISYIGDSLLNAFRTSIGDQTIINRTLYHPSLRGESCYERD